MVSVLFYLFNFVISVGCEALNMPAPLFILLSFLFFFYATFDSFFSLNLSDISVCLPVSFLAWASSSLNFLLINIFLTLFLYYFYIKKTLNNCGKYGVVIAGVLLVQLSINILSYFYDLNAAKISASLFIFNVLFGIFVFILELVLPIIIFLLNKLNNLMTRWDFLR